MAITIRFTGETSKMSWAELPVEPACMGKAVGEAEHRQNRNFDKMKIVGNVSTLDGASQWETNRIQTYMNNHKGQTPLYNQNEHGK